MRALDSALKSSVIHRAGCSRARAAGRTLINIDGRVEIRIAVKKNGTVAQTLELSRSIHRSGETKGGPRASFFGMEDAGNYRDYLACGERLNVFSSNCVVSPSPSPPWKIKNNSRAK